LGEFNPGTSEREKRKLTTKKKTTTVTSRTKPPIFDEKGILIHFQKDLCDCLVEECQGEMEEQLFIMKCTSEMAQPTITKLILY
jgi:hypothetical protein